MPETWFADLPISEKFPIYTRANAGEVMPDPVSPLGASLGLIAAGEQGWRDAYANTGTCDQSDFESDRPNTIGYFGGHLFLNMSMTRLFGARFPGMTPEQVDLQYFGTMPGIPPYVAEDWHTSEVHSARLTGFLMWTFTQTDLPELRADAQRVQAIVDGRPDFSTLSNRELLARARSLQGEYRALFERHIGTSSASGIGVGTVAGVCQAIGRPELLMPLISAAGDVDSAAPSWAMWEMSRTVKNSPTLTALFDANSRDLHSALMSGASDGNADVVKLREQLASFTSKFGSRGPNEWELRSLTWELKPNLVLVAVDRMRAMADSESPQHHTDRLKAERERVTAEVLAMLAGNDEATGQFLGGLNVALLFSAGRERSKTNNIRIVHEQRLALREVGRRMVDAGHLDNVEQIFMLQDGVPVSEFEAYLADPASMKEMIRAREKDYLELFDYVPPFIIDGVVPPLNTWARKSSAAAVAQVGAGDVLTGIAGCPGVATGIARVILDPSDPFALEPGDILVAPVTDPAWTPLFVPAAAVVVDVGAQITHAVIVSRELGIPCVVSVTDATKKIPNGARITVDGTNGTVTIH
jgi:rifampicin phosphotransferase